MVFRGDTMFHRSSWWDGMDTFLLVSQNYSTLKVRDLASGDVEVYKMRDGNWRQYHWLFKHMLCDTCREEEELPSSAFVTLPAPHPLDEVLDSNFRKCLTDYFVRYEWWYPVTYHNIYFFEKDSVDYFTIWVSEWGPNSYLYNWGKPDIPYDYYWLCVGYADVILVKRQTDTRNLPFQDSENMLVYNRKESIPIKLEVVRDVFYMRTFKYYFDGEKFCIGGLRDTIYLDERTLRHENRLLKEENQKLGLSSKELYPIYK